MFFFYFTHYFPRSSSNLTRFFYIEECSCCAVFSRIERAGFPEWNNLVRDNNCLIRQASDKMKLVRGLITDMRLFEVQNLRANEERARHHLGFFGSRIKILLRRWAWERMRGRGARGCVLERKPRKEFSRDKRRREEGVGKHRRDIPGKMIIRSWKNFGTEREKERGGKREGRTVAETRQQFLAMSPLRAHLSWKRFRWNTIFTMSNCWLSLG